jgi:hypothetical protein
MRTLTKSRFKLALQCITKLYYTKKVNEYADERIDDPFLKALAEGGFQVGELAKFEFSNDPVGEGITINTLNEIEAIERTNQKLKNDKTVIAEAAFKFETLFVRSDIIVKTGNIIDVYEVKSKSFDSNDLKDGFITTRGVERIRSQWFEYLYDIAFQKYVIVNSLKNEGFIVRAHLMLVDKDSHATVDGLNQRFKIAKTDEGRSIIKIEPGLRREHLGASILKKINVDNEISKIWNQYPVPTDYRNNMSFEQFVNLCADIYNKDERVFTPIGKKCKECQFTNNSNDNRSLKSGFIECWKHATNYTDELLIKDLVLDLWGGGLGSRSIVQELIDQKKYLIESLTEVDVIPSTTPKQTVGLNAFQRRMEQISRVRKNTKESYFDKQGILNEMQGWKYPLHMIDFETSMPALPFHKSRNPYEGIAFQFSHHIIENNGEVRHAGQYLSFKRGVFPNYEFVRKLMLELSSDDGSIFRYHNHENTYLRMISKQLDEDKEPPADKEELKIFTDSITQTKVTDNGKERPVFGPRNMIDLYDLVIRYYYPPYAKGNNSIKSILPAIIHESNYLKEKYCKPIYGIDKEVKSLNYTSHTWISPEFNYDPYKTLPKIFGKYEFGQIDHMLYGFDELRDGGAAMTAYCYLQFAELSNQERDELRDGLLRYCELDTMAMVMIIEGFWEKLKA